MCDCFHLAFPNWHAASSGTGGGRRLRGPETGAQADSICDEPSQFTEGERPRPQGSSPVEEYPETEKYTDSDKEGEAEYDPHYKSGSGKKIRKPGLGFRFDKRATPKMSKLKEVHSPESGVIVKTAKDGCAEGLVYGGGGKDGLFIKEVVPESPASKSLKLKEGDQILSATVYFDDIPYEDAIQILEHAQAYKVKLCLKRRPDITETESALKSEVINEEECFSPEMREQGKTKRRGDARISWPKFPSLGRGRKSHFTRSHSTSEADEQRKLELSPTTSDTESPIKSQDVLKGKKRHKMKLPALTKKGHISSSEDKDTDASTTGQIIGADIHQTQDTSEVRLPESLVSSSGKSPAVYGAKGIAAVEDIDLKPDQSEDKLTESQKVKHRMELIAIDSTLKTTDLTVAMADQESPFSVKSPDRKKKKKKERSELKMKITGKDKSHKQEAKAKSSPKRLQALGASIEIADQANNEKSSTVSYFESHTELQENLILVQANEPLFDSESSRRILPKSVKTQREISAPEVELDIADVTFTQKSPQHPLKEKDFKHKVDTNTAAIYKLPKIGLTDIVTEETIQRMDLNVEKSSIKTKHVETDGAELREDAYDKLSKTNLSKTHLPKREDIEIPGMEDVSKRITSHGIKVPKAVFNGNSEEIQTETVQLSIDVDSVKEAVSKLPGFKLPKVDVSGAPIPEEITVIDANAQRISVKTPTKVVDYHKKHETHFTQFDITSPAVITKTTVKLPKISPADLTSHEFISEIRVDDSMPKKEHKYKSIQSQQDIKSEFIPQEDKIIPGRESTQEVLHRQAQKTDADIRRKGFGTDLHATKPDIKIPVLTTNLPKVEISLKEKKKAEQEKTEKIKEKRREEKTVETEEKGKRFKLPKIGVSLSNVKEEEIYACINKNEEINQLRSKSEKQFTNVELKQPLGKIEVKVPEIDSQTELHDTAIKLPKFEAAYPNTLADINTLDKDVHIDGNEILSREEAAVNISAGTFEADVGVSKTKIKEPKIDFDLSNEDVPFTLSQTMAEVKLPDAPEMKVTLQKAEAKPSELEIRDLHTEGELDGHELFRMPKFGIKMPKIKEPEIDLKLSKKKVDIPETAVEVKLPETPKISVEKELTEIGGKETKFKMPMFGITMPKGKGPEADLSLAKKDVGVKLPEIKAEVQVSDVELKHPSAQVEIKVPEIKVAGKGTDRSQSRFKMPTFKLPKFGSGISNVTTEVPEMEKYIKIGGVDINMPEDGPEINIEAPGIDIEVPSIDIKTTGPKLEQKLPEAKVSLLEDPKIAVDMKPTKLDKDTDGHESKFKMPKFGISMPKVKGPEIDLSLSKKDVEVTLPEAKAEVQLPDVELKHPSAQVEIKGPEIKVAGKDTDGSPSRFKMPTFKLPSFGSGTPKITAEVPDVEKDIKIGGVDINIPEDGPEVNIEAPSIDIEGPSVDIKTEGPKLEGKGSKFKMPHFSFSVPKVKGPEIDVNLSKQDADVTLPEVEAEVSLPEAPKISLDIKPPEVEKETDGQENKFKMPKFGISMPKVKGREIDLSLSKKDVDVTLPEAKAEVQLPEVELKHPSAQVEIKGPEIKVAGKDTDGSPSRFKMPTFKLPSFGSGTPKITAEVPDVEKDIKIGGVDINIPEDGPEVNIEAPSIDIEGPSVDIKTEGPKLEGKGSKFKMPHLSFSVPKVKGPEIDVNLSKQDADVTLPEVEAEVSLPEAPKISLDIKPPEVEKETDGQENKFKMPKFGISMPKVKGPEIDLSLSKKDVDVTLPEAKAEVQLPEVELKHPSAQVEIKGPEIKVAGKDTDGSPSRFKMPTFKLPSFGSGTPKITAEVPDMEKDIKVGGVDINIPEDGPEVNIEAPGIDIEGPSVDIKTEGPKLEGKGSKFKMPHLSFSVPKVKGPEIDVNLSQKDADVTLPEAEAEVSLPQAPKISVDIKPPEVEKDTDGHESKFKMPKFGITMPSVKGPEIDLSLSKKDVDVTLPEAKAEVQLPDVELKHPSAQVEIKGPEIKVAGKDTDGSPSRFKMPTFKLPKFGSGTPNITAEVPDMEKNIKVGGVDINIPEDGPEVNIEAPGIDIEGPSVDIKTEGPKLEGKGSKFKMPHLSFSVPKVKGPEIDVNLSQKDADVTLPEAEAEVSLPQAPKISVDIKPPKVEKKTDGHESKFKMPKFGITMPSVKGPEIDLSLSKKDVDVTLPEAKAEVQLPDVELKHPSAQVEIKGPEIKVAGKDTDGSPSRFKMPTFKLPKFGSGTPNITAEVPDMEKDIKVGGVDINIPEAGPEVNIEAPGIDIEGPSVDIKTEGPKLEGKGSKFKMPHLSFSVPKVKGPEIDVNLPKKDAGVTLPEVEAEVSLPEAPKIAVDIKPPEVEKDTDGHESKFKMPKFGITMPSVKGREIDLSLSKKDVEVTLPEAKAEVQLPDVELKHPSAQVEIKGPEIKVAGKDTDGSPSRFKMPTFKLPKFGSGTPKITAEVPDMEKDIKVGGVDINIPEAGPEVNIEAPGIDIEGPSVDIKTEGPKLEGKGSKFKMPHLSFSVPKVKGPEIDVNLSKQDADVTLPEAEAEVSLPEAPKISVDIKPPEVEKETDGHESKFKMPKFGITMPSVKGPEIDLSLSKKDVDVTLPEAKAEVQLPDVELKHPSAQVEIKGPDIKVAGKDTDGSPSRFKMPTFKLPSFGSGTRKITAEVPDMEKDIKIGGADINIPEAGPEVNIEAPGIDIEGPSVDIKTEGPKLEGKGSKFKMPHLSFSVPKVKGPEIDVNLSKQDADVTLPEVEAEVSLPEAPKISVDIKPPEVEKDTDGHESKFKMPKFGISMPKVKGPEIDLSLSKKDIDVTLPEAKAEVQLPEVELKHPSAQVEIKGPEIKVAGKDTDGSPSRFKMPTFKLPKFGSGTPNITAEVPDMEKDIKIGGIDINIPEDGPEVNIEAPGIDIEGPSVDIKTEGPKLEGKGSKFKMPHLSFSVPKVKGPEIDLSLSKKDVDVTLPEAKAEVQLPDVELKHPSAQVEIKAPEIKLAGKDTDGSPSRFKMPTFKLPSFGSGTPKITAEVPDMEKDIKVGGVDINIPEAGPEVNIEAPGIDIEGPSVDIKTEGPKLEGKGSKFKMPHFSFSVPKVKGPEIDVNLSKQDADVTLPEAEAEVSLPQALKIAVDIKPPEVEKDTDGHAGKFKMPKFGITMPSVKGREIDLSLSKKDVDVTLPEAKAEVQLPDVELKHPSAQVEIKAPEIKVAGKDTDGSPSRFKMPTFKLPSFGSGTPKITAEVPDVEKDIKIGGVDINIPEAGPEVNIEAPGIDIEGPSVDIKTEGPKLEGKGSKFKMPHFSFSVPKVKGPEIDVNLSKQDADVTLPEAEAEVSLPQALKIAVDIKPPEVEKDTDGHESKFKMPKFGISMPKVKGPEIDLSLSKKDIDVTLPEAKAEVQLPDVELKHPSAQVEIKGPEIKVAGKDTDGSPSRFKMPTFKLPKFGSGTSNITAEVPDMEKDIKIGGVDINIPEAGPEVNIEAPGIDIEGPSVDIKTEGPKLEGKGSKFKMPHLSFSVPKVKGPEIDVNLPKKDADVTLPEAEAEVSLPEAPKISVDIKPPEVEKETDGHESKFKMPKFGISMPKVKGPEIDLSLSKKDVDVTLPEAKAEVQLPEVELKHPSAQVEIKGPEIKVAGKDTDGSPSRFKMPTFKLPSFGSGTPKITAEVPDMEKDIKIGGVDINIPEDGPEVNIEAPGIDIEGPSVDIKTEGPKLEGKGSKFKMPHLSFSVPKVKGPEIDVNLSQKDADVTLPEAEVSLPEAPKIAVDIKPPGVEKETDGHESKFKMPKFGISMPKVKGPEIDLSLSKKDVEVTLPEAKAEVQLPDVELKDPTAKVEIKAPEIKVAGKDTDGSPSRFKMPTFKLPSFGSGTPKITAEVPDVEKDIKVGGVDINIPEAGPEVNIEAPSIDIEGPSVDIKTEGPKLEGKGSKFKMPHLSFSVPKVKGPEIDVNLSQKDVDVTLPEAEVSLPQVPKMSVDIKPPEAEKDTDGHESKFKMPKFGISMPKVKGPEIDLSLSKKDVDVTLPEAKAEVQLPDVELKHPSAQVEIKGPEIKVAGKDTDGSPSRFKMPTFKLPSFGSGTPKITAEVPDMEKDIKVGGVDINIPEAGPEVNIEAPGIDIEGPSVDIKTEGPKLEGKGSKFKMTHLSVSVPKVKGPEIDVNLSKQDADVTLPEVEAEISLPKAPKIAVDIKPPKLGNETDGEESKFQMPKFGITMPKVKGPETDFILSKKAVDVTLPEGESKVQFPNVTDPEVRITTSDTDVEGASIHVKNTEETEEKGIKFKMPHFGISSPNVNGAESDLKEDSAVIIKGPSIEIKTDTSKAISDSELPKTETHSVDHGSPSKFKLPSFKMPKLSFSKLKPEEENAPIDTEFKHDQLKMEGEAKVGGQSSKVTLTSFGEILKNIDVAFDAPIKDKVEDNLETTKEVQETDQVNVCPSAEAYHVQREYEITEIKSKSKLQFPSLGSGGSVEETETVVSTNVVKTSGKLSDQKENEKSTKQDTIKSPEKAGWFKFPKFGLSSPTELAKTSEKDKHMGEKSTVSETVDEEISPTSSIQSSDAFADISSTMTSETVGLSLSSPTKVTVKYSDPSTGMGFGEMHSNVITSTTRTEQISVEPSLPEKITIMSSGVSSSSEDTLKLESRKIHVITSNIQATPGTQHAKLLTAVHIQSATDLPLKTQASESEPQSGEDSQTSKKTVFERHMVQKMSTKEETVVITKQITRVFGKDSSEPISDETASSIRQLKDSMHSEKMKFFDGTEK